MDNDEFTMIAGGMLIMGPALCLVGLLGYSGYQNLNLFGSRGERKIYESRYNSEPICIIQEDRRFAEDHYSIRFSDGRTSPNKRITTDDGEIIKVGESYYNIIRNGRYIMLKK